MTEPAPTPPNETDLQRELDDARATIARLERRQRIDDLLRESGTIDHEAARLLTELTVEQMDAPDLAAAVADLKAHKPYLFQRSFSTHAAHLMAQRDDEPNPEPDDAAARAAATGHRRDLLRYLRLKRTTPRR